MCRAGLGKGRGFQMSKRIFKNFPGTGGHTVSLDIAKIVAVIEEKDYPNKCMVYLEQRDHPFYLESTRTQILDMLRTWDRFL
jgi:hypothetical protein